jgi:hypothetical protein
MIGQRNLSLARRLSVQAAACLVVLTITSHPTKRREIAAIQCPNP